MTPRKQFATDNILLCYYFITTIIISIFSLFKMTVYKTNKYLQDTCNKHVVNTEKPRFYVFVATI